MTALRTGAALACLTSALWFGGCRFDEDRNAAVGCERCPEGSCHAGFCFAPRERTNPATGSDGRAGEGESNGGGRGGDGEAGDDAAAPSAGTGGAGAAGRGGSGGGQAPGDAGEPSCVEGDFCYDGPEGTRTLGRCRAGAMSCNGEGLVACLGQITPADEICNGVDDDCDDAVDEAVELGSCQTGGQGSCAAGMLRCVDGASVCESTVAAEAETCNDVDDDCDGMTDERSTLACYEAATGCVPEDAQFVCEGQCRAGEQACTDGALQACAGAIGPATDACEGTDEDCDGEIDEGCQCLNGATQSCYNGPTGTADVGICRRGMQTCVNGAFGPCTGAVMPAAESCANEGADDDCDGLADDVIGRGDPCTVDANAGICRAGSRQCADGALACVTPQPPPDAATAGEAACDGRDEDCDGAIDDGFDLQNDPAHCGMCGRSCETGQTCCGGACVLMQSDPLHCGACGNACGEGMACCAGVCVDLQTNAANCGACAVDCAAIGEALGRSCSCEMGACTSPGGPCAM